MWSKKQPYDKLFGKSVFQAWRCGKLSRSGVRFDVLKVLAWHDAIVKNLLKGGSFGLIILGGDHDLSENVRRLGESRCEYVRVTMKQFKLVGVK